MFLMIRLFQGGSILEGVDSPADWGNLLGVFEPLTAILIGTVLFGEPLTPKMAAGVAICVGAVVFMILKPRRN